MMVLIFFILGFFILGIIVIGVSKIKINVENLNIDSSNPKAKEDFNIRITIGPLDVKLLDVVIGEKQLKNIFKESIRNIKLEKEKIEIQKNVYHNVVKELKKANIKLEKLNLHVAIGTEECALTAYLVGATAAIIANIIPYLYNSKKGIENYQYQVLPVYNKNFSKLDLNCIISAKLVHIIYIIFLIWKGSRKYERTSNRKFDEYSYE